MTNETIIETVEKMLSDIIADADFLVSIKVRPTNNIKVFVDTDEGGISIDKCVKYNRALYRQLEETGLFPDGDFSLEVSSPGVTEPLKLHRQYVKNKGRLVEVTFVDGSIKEGTLLEVTEQDILIENTTGKGKKAETKQYLIPFENIKTTKVQIQF
jgi:ribosome maturation factor RimP